ncbi:MAG: FHA domain-containing protein [Fuerstiella sp.]|nr:FHA domain-containing protein [Fuerstiella sp.]
MNFSGQIYPADTVGYFRVASSARRQPVEPVSIGEFLIGSAAHCQLRFGDVGIPDVHTCITVQHTQVRLTCEVTEPALLVNGTPVSECQLFDGDLLEIGGHRLLFRLAADAGRITLDEEAFALDESSAKQADTVESLVERLEEQTELVEDLTRTPDDGVLELLQAVAETRVGDIESSDQQAVAAADSERDSDVPHIAGMLQKHHDSSRIRLESLTEVLDNVVKQQKLIADTLAVMSDRIQALDSDSGYQHRRASA